MKILKRSFLVFFLLCFSNLNLVYAEEFQCEVMSIEGSATVTNAAASHRLLKEGDLLKASDLVEVGANSTVDLAYDKDWQNVTRLEENSKVEIQSIYPTTLKLAYGGVFAKLKSIPRESTFTVETPTAIAAVRGTEYRTVSSEEEGTQVYNFSDSQVYVFGQDQSGKMSETPTIVENSQAMEITRPGAAPGSPRQITSGEFHKGGQFREGIEKKVQENIARGRIAKTPDIRAIEKIHRERMQAAGSGRGALTSLEPGQEKNARLKELMNREDRMLQRMDNARKSPGQRQGQNNAQAGSKGPGRVQEGQGNPQGQGDGNGQPAGRKPQPRRGGAPSPSRPPR